MKRWMILILAIGLLLLPLSTLADDTIYTEGYFFYTIEDMSITITGYFGNEIEVTVPASIGGIPVNAIGPNAFAGTTVRILHLPDTIRELGENATGDAEFTFMGQTQPPASAPSTAKPQQSSAHPATATPYKTAQPNATNVVGNEGEIIAGPIPFGENEVTPQPAGPVTEAPQQTLAPETVVTPAPIPIEPQKEEATALPIEAEAIEASETPAPTEAAQTITEQPQEPQSYLWVWFAAGGAVLAAIAAVVLIRKTHKR